MKTLHSKKEGCTLNFNNQQLQPRYEILTFTSNIRF